jgi:hypothetical protein
VEAKQFLNSTKSKPKRKMQATKGKAKDAWKNKGKIGLQPEDMIRKYKFSYPLVIYEGRNLTEADVLLTSTFISRRFSTMRQKMTLTPTCA